MRAASVAICLAASVSPILAHADQAPAPAPEGPATATPPPANTPPPPPAPAAQPEFEWHPFGFLRMEYIAVQDDPNVAFVGRNDGFEIQNARLGAIGRLGSRVGFALSFDGAVDERTQVNSPQGNLAVGLRDAFVDVRLTESRPLVARAGFFQTLVDPEALVPDTSREFVDKPIETRGMVATEGYQTPGLPPGRSQGVALRFDPQVGREDGVAAGFELAAQNGADEFSSNNDNDALALSATGILAMPHGSWVVASVRYNPRTVGDLPFRQDENDLQGTLGLHAVVGPLSLTGGGIVQRTTFPTTGGPVQNAFGAHAQAMVRVYARTGAESLWVGYRFGVLDPSSLVTTDRVIEHTAGALLVVPRYRMRFQLQAVHVVEQTGRELSNDRIQLAGEVVL